MSLIWRFFFCLREEPTRSIVSLFSALLAEVIGRFSCAFSGGSDYTNSRIATVFYKRDALTFLLLPLLKPFHATLKRGKTEAAGHFSPNM